MKLLTLLITTLFLSFILVQQADAHKTDPKYTFRIVGKNRIPFYSRGASEMTVDYDTASINHLYITEFKKDGFLKTRTRLLFKGERFNLERFAEYASQGKLLVDGIQADFREDETIGSELLYKEEKLLQKTFYYPNGNKQMLIAGNEAMMNGEFKVWYPNSQLNFSGNYKNNLKDGEFQQFDENGRLLKKGVYTGGKLVSGEAVVQDITYKTPDQPAKFPGGEIAFNAYLRMKTTDLKIVKDLEKDEVHYIDLKMTVSKTGSIYKIDFYGYSKPTDNEILNAAFFGFPGFIPAMVENIPVSSILPLFLNYTTEGLQSTFESESSADSAISDSLMGPPFTVVEEMPKFPGGENECKKFVASNLRYPLEAAEKGIQGKVLVHFVIGTDGMISNIKVVLGVYKYLDAEAVRLIRKMPTWKPGRQGGKNVRVAYTIPIDFRLQ